MLSSGLLVAGGSDSHVSPMDPLLCVHSAVNHPNLAQRISALEALRLFTTNAARAAFQETDIGGLAPGRFADLVVLAEDPLVASPERLKDIRVLMTVVGGHIRFHDRGGISTGRA